MQNILTTSLVIDHQYDDAKEHDYPIRDAIKGILWNASLWNTLADFKLFTMTADSVLFYYVGKSQFEEYGVTVHKEDDLLRIQFRDDAYILTIRLI